MAGFTQGYSQTLLDYGFPTTGGGDYIAYSANGTSESAALGRTAIGATGWAAATAAQPSVKANASALTSPAATAAATITHFAIFSAASGGTQKTDWTALASSRALVVGDQLTHAAGAIGVTLD